MKVVTLFRRCSSSREYLFGGILSAIMTFGFALSASAQPLTMCGGGTGGLPTPWAQVGDDIYYNVVNGNVGVGTNSPEETFHVNGSVRFEDLASCGRFVTDADGTLSCVQNAANTCPGGEAIQAINADGTVTCIAAGASSVPDSRTISTTAPLSGGGDLSANRTISISQANTNTAGYLSFTDWNTFNGKQPGDSTLTALAAYSTNGILTQTAADTFIGRTITGTANQVTVTNGSGVAGDPTLALPQDIHTGADVEFKSLTLDGTAVGGLKLEGTHTYGLFAADQNGAAVANLTPGMGSHLSLVPMDGDGTDDTVFAVVPVTGDDYEHFEFGYQYNAGDPYYQIESEAGGTGTVRPIKINTFGNNNQLYLGTDGFVGIGTDSPNAPLHVYKSDAGAYEPIATFERNSTETFTIDHKLRNDAAESVNYFQTQVIVSDDTDGAEDGYVSNTVMGDGTLLPVLGLSANGGAAILTFGGNGASGNTIYVSEQGATDFTVTIQPNSATTENYTIKLPADAGGNGQVLAGDGNGALSWADFPDSAVAWGDITGTLSNQADLQSALDAKVATTRTLSTTSPLAGGGDLSANRTLSIDDALADGATKGAASFAAADFNAASGNISIDYANGQEANGTVDGFLNAANWNTFNGKQAGDATLTALAGYNTNGILTQTGADTFVGRTITGTANQVTVTDGNGVAGNPTLSLPQDIHTAASPSFTGLYASQEIGIGVTDASYHLQISGTANTIASVESYSAVAGQRPSLLFVRARGTAASPTAVLQNDLLGSIAFDGWDTNQSSGGGIHAWAAADWGTAGDSTDSPTDITFSLAPDGSSTTAEVMRVASTARVGIGNIAPSYKLDVTGAIRSGDNGTDGQLILYSEQGATDYSVTFNPAAAMTGNTIYTLPVDDGTASQFLQTDGAGVLSWSSAQASDALLTALAANSSTGITVLTGNDTYTTRTITAPAAGITVSNGNGVSGNPTLALANDLSALEGLASTGLAARTSSDTWAQRTITAPAAGITVSNGDGVSGNPTLALANDLSALEGLASTGIAVRTASDTWAQRTITGTSLDITVSNGNGVSGNPTLTLDRTATLAGNPALAASTAAFATTGIIFEGSSADTYETLLTAANTTSSDKTITLPDETGTVTLGTGTANYVPKFTDTNIIGNSLIYDSGTKVGVGTSSPQTMLHVEASADEFSTNSSGVLIEAPATSATFFRSDQNANYTGALWFMGRPGCDEGAEPSCRTGMGFSRWNNPPGGAPYTFGANPFVVDLLAPNKSLNVSSSGNVMLGAAGDYGSKLSIVSTVVNNGGDAADNNTVAHGILFAGDTDTLDNNQNNVGIYSMSGIWPTNEAAAGGGLALGTRPASGSVTERVRILSTGRVGIGTTNPSYLLELPNVATSTGGQGRANAWVTYSDARFKVEREKVTQAVEKIKLLNPLYYKWQNTTHDEDGKIVAADGVQDKREIGFLAQEVYQILPEVVYKPANEDTDMWSLNYEKLTPLLVTAVQEQQTDIEQLKSDVEQLKQENQQLRLLEDRVKALEAANE